MQPLHAIGATESFTLAPSEPLQSALFFESPAEMYARVLRHIRPRAPLPDIEVHFRRYANANSSIRLESGRLTVKIADILEGAPAPILESLAFLLLGKLYKRPVPPIYARRYRMYLNRRDVREKLSLVRQLRGRKFVSGPQGAIHNLEEIFERLNENYFGGLLGRPLLGWSRGRSRSMLGHFDPCHNTIVISRIFDDSSMPLLALEYVMFHEMLHLRYPVDHRGVRRRVHTREFKQAEQQFERLTRAKQLLKTL